MGKDFPKKDTFMRSGLLQQHEPVNQVKHEKVMCTLKAPSCNAKVEDQQCSIRQSIPRFQRNTKTRNLVGLCPLACIHKLLHSAS